MSIDYAEFEREFVSTLDVETGTGLDGWMSAIAASQHSGRNDIIDWLRHRGFSFAQASWLERIYHNGGALIYGTITTTEIASDERPAAAELVIPPVQIEPVVPLLKLDDEAITAILSAAKGLRPLADLILKEVAGVIGNLDLVPRGSYIELQAPQPFGALVPGPKVLKFYADLGPDVKAPAKAAGTAAKGQPAFPAVIELNDARRVDTAFLSLVRDAHIRRHS